MKSYKLEKIAEDIYYLDIFFKENKNRECKLSKDNTYFYICYREEGENEDKEVLIEHGIENKEILAVDIFKRDTPKEFKAGCSIAFLIRLIYSLDDFNSGKIIEINEEQMKTSSIPQNF